MVNASDSGRDAREVFRLDNETLAFRFTATVSSRRADPFERLTTPERLDLWLDANGLRLGSKTACAADLAAAHALQEAVYRAGKAVADRRRPDPADIAAVNAAVRQGRAYLELGEESARWRSDGPAPVGDALALIAENAIQILGGHDRQRVKACEGPGCGGLYLDTSRGGNRRWCSMNTCGNRAKKAAMRVPRRQTPPT
ncbi:CGNR zinc finger domain-containing protein [Streptosporangium lutulentum]